MSRIHNKMPGLFKFVHYFNLEASSFSDADMLVHVALVNVDRAFLSNFGENRYTDQTSQANSRRVVNGD